jgi:hypothetical protein
MAGTQILAGSLTGTTDRRAGSKISSRAGLRLWTWLHAQALLNGTASGPAAAAEDDRSRLISALLSHERLDS